MTRPYSKTLYIIKFIVIVTSLQSYSVIQILFGLRAAAHCLIRGHFKRQDRIAAACLLGVRTPPV